MHPWLILHRFRTIARRDRRFVAALAAAVVAPVVASPMSASAAPFALPAPNGVFDYQLGGAYAPDPAVQIVSRDRTVAPVAGVYNVCYVNLMQTQPDDGSASSSPAYGTTAWWKKAHPDLLLRDASGAVVIDANWNEALFDVRTAAKRVRLAKIQAPWLKRCKADGFQAVEPDNIDAESRSKGLMSHAQVRAYVKMVVLYAHSAGLAIAQKNALSSDAGAEWATDGARFVTSVSPAQGFDFAIAEECQPNAECADFAAMYGGRVYEVEYQRSAFSAACADHGSTMSVTLRDRDVTPKGSAGFVYDAC